MSEETLRGPLYIDKKSRRLYEVASMDRDLQATVIDGLTRRSLQGGDYLNNYHFNSRPHDPKEYLGGYINTDHSLDYSQLPFCKHLFHRVHND